MERVSDIDWELHVQRIHIHKHAPDHAGQLRRKLGQGAAEGPLSRAGRRTLTPAKPGLKLLAIMMRFAPGCQLNSNIKANSSGSNVTVRLLRGGAVGGLACVRVHFLLPAAQGVACGGALVRLCFHPPMPPYTLQHWENLYRTTSNAWGGCSWGGLTFDLQNSVSIWVEANCTGAAMDGCASLPVLLLGCYAHLCLPAAANLGGLSVRTCQAGLPLAGQCTLSCIYVVPPETSCLLSASSCSASSCAPGATPAHGFV